MADISIPRTPSPVLPSSKSGFTSLTPPPTTQANRYGSFTSAHDRAQQNRTTQGLGRLPTLEEARSFSAQECRDLVIELLPIVGETRMALAHAQLQLNLLSIEAKEAAQRAEVEHEMARREAEVLRAGSPVLRGRGAALGDQTPITQLQQQLEAAIEAGRDLEEDNFQLKNRLRQAKRVIKHLNGQKLQLSEDNNLLRERIKQNRAHMDATRSANPTQTPRAFQSPNRVRTNRMIRSATPAQNPLDALLMADQILSADPSSMPATPSPHRMERPRNGHTRGVQSLSSLPSTPTRIRRMSATELLATPQNRIIYTNPNAAAYTAPAKQSRETRLREDRDGTISASEDEALTDEDTIPASQASQAASSMLKKNPSSGSQQYPWMRPAPGPGAPNIAPTSGAAGVPNDGSKAAVVEDAHDGRPKKKTKIAGADVGLGIQVWGSPAR